MSSRIGTLLVVSGPSGSGKTTLCRRLANAGEAHYSISCTTRNPRPGETNGIDYHFLSRDAFQQKIQENAFLEYAEVHGNFYGSLKSEVLEYLNSGTDVVMDIDVQGAIQVRSCQDPAIQRSFTDLFVMPHDESELLHRLSHRGTDAPDVIALRMKNALEEIQHFPQYSYLLRSTDRESDFQQFFALLTAERLKTSRLR